MIAYRADVSEEIIIGILNLVATNAITTFFNIRNIHGETFLKMLLEEYGQEARLSFAPYTSLLIVKQEELMEQEISLSTICDISWWQQFESEDVSLKTKNISPNSLSYGTCRDGDTL